VCWGTSVIDKIERKKEPLKKVQNGKIENVAGFV
jgi:hypothetical protein